jgi:HK97 family phage portal protein
MWPFGKTITPEVKVQSPTISGFVYAAPAPAAGLTRKGSLTYEQVACEAYQKNVIAYRAIDEVANAVATPPWLFYRTGARQPTELPLPLVLQRPNPWQSWPTLLGDAVRYYLLSGNCYLEALAPSVRQPPTQLYLHRPDKVRPVPGRFGIAAYAHLVNGTWQNLWPVDPVTGQSNILHLKAFHPLDDLVGLSPIEAAALGIDVHNDANTWNGNLLRKGAAADIALISEKPVSDPQFARMKEQLTRDVSGKNNAGGFLLLEPGAGGSYSFEKISFSPRDMSWVEAKNTSAHDVALALGGSAMPFLLGLSNLNTFANQETGRLAFWDTTVIPFLTRIVGEVTNWLGPRYGEGLYFETDLDEVPALEPRREQTWNRIRQSDFLTINEKREALGYNRVDGGDVILQPATLLPLGEAAPPPPTQQNADTFERELVVGGLSPDLATELRTLTFPTANGVVH